MIFKTGQWSAIFTCIYFMQAIDVTIVDWVVKIKNCTNIYSFCIFPVAVGVGMNPGYQQPPQMMSGMQGVTTGVNQMSLNTGQGEYRM